MEKSVVNLNRQNMVNLNRHRVVNIIANCRQRNKDGSLKTRKGGLKDRLINGYHPNQFGQITRIKRHKAFPMQMVNENILELKIYWWVTYDTFHKDFPTDIESLLSEKYIQKHTKLPDWHKS